MDSVLSNGTTKIGVYHFPDRKKPCLCVAEGSSIVICGSFNSEQNAEFFMHKLCAMFGIEECAKK